MHTPTLVILGGSYLVDNAVPYGTPAPYPVDFRAPAPLAWMSHHGATLGFIRSLIHLSIYSINNYRTSVNATYFSVY